MQLTIAHVWLLLAWQTVCAEAQGTFQNLNFEAANVPAATPAGTLVPVGSALPGWTVYLGADQQTTVLYSGSYLDSASVSLFGPSAPPGGVISGSYSAMIHEGAYLFVGNIVSASIAQTGLLRVTAKSLLFTSSLVDSGFSVTVGGANIPVSQFSRVGGYPVYGGDISAFAGQVVELRFTDSARVPIPAFGIQLDNIVFSDNPIPEPATAVLVLYGAAMAGMRLRTRKRCDRDCLRFKNSSRA